MDLALARARCSSASQEDGHAHRHVAAAGALAPVPRARRRRCSTHPGQRRTHRSPSSAAARKADRRHDHARARAATTWTPVLVDGFFPTVAPRRDAGARAARRAPGARPALRGRCRRSRATSRASSRGRRPAADGAAAIRRGPSGLACPTHVLFNGGVMKAASLRDADRRRAERRGWRRRLRAARRRPRARRAGPRSRRRARRGLLRAGAARTRRPHPQRRRAHATTSASRARCRRCPGMPAPLKALCVVPFGMEEGTSAPIAGARVRPRRRRAGGVPLPRRSTVRKTRSRPARSSRTGATTSRSSARSR